MTPTEIILLVVSVAIISYFIGYYFGGKEVINQLWFLVREMKNRKNG